MSGGYGRADGLDDNEFVRNLLASGDAVNDPELGAASAAVFRGACRSARAITTNSGDDQSS